MNTPTPPTASASKKKYQHGTEQTPLTAFKEKLAKHDLSYHCDDSLPTTMARVQFVGMFKSEEILWEMKLSTLDHYLNSQDITTQNPPLGCRAFINVLGKNGHIRKIEVGLDVNTIDHATILKTMIMIRNYKRLAPGLHQFGPVRPQ